MTSRPLHAVLLPPADAAGRLLDRIAAALDGTGPAILPLDAALPRARVAALIDALAPSVVETADGRERYAATPPGGPAPGVSPETALVIATSGSTGPAKGTELGAAALLASARASLRRIGARPGERWLLCLPAFHIAGIQVLVRSLLAGAAPVVPDGRLGPGTLAASGCAHVAMVPTQLRRLVDAGTDLSAVATILLGGAAAPPGLLDAARAAGGRVVTTYGMSETSGGCVYDGFPLDDVSVDIGLGGRIRIAGPVLFSGYRLRPDQTARARDGRWFVTSDLGSIGPSGELVIRGRADDVIITGGEKVVAAEVEAALATCAGVREAAVVGRPDAEWGELVTAVVVAADPAAPPRLAEIRAHVRDRLPPCAAPAALLLVPDMPLLASGKPDRAALKARAAGAPQGAITDGRRAHDTDTGTNDRVERY